MNFYFFIFSLLFAVIGLLADEVVNYDLSLGKYSKVIQEVEAVYIVDYIPDNLYNKLHELDVIIYDIIAPKLNASNYNTSKVNNRIAAIKNISLKYSKTGYLRSANSIEQMNKMLMYSKTLDEHFRYTKLTPDRKVIGTLEFRLNNITFKGDFADLKRRIQNLQFDIDKLNELNSYGAGIDTSTRRGKTMAATKIYIDAFHYQKLRPLIWLYEELTETNFEERIDNMDNVDPKVRFAKFSKNDLPSIVSFFENNQNIYKTVPTKNQFSVPYENVGGFVILKAKMFGRSFYFDTDDYYDKKHSINAFEQN